jgi:hypothetical protein
MMKPSRVAAIPQMHSSDYYLRINRGQLERIVFEHLYTVQDRLLPINMPADARLLGGITEWQGAFQNYAVSLAWDWGRRSDGGVEVMQAILPRTNVKLIDSRGYDLMDAEAATPLWALISALPWQGPVLEVLPHLGSASRH